MQIAVEWLTSWFSDFWSGGVYTVKKISRNPPWKQGMHRCNLRAKGCISRGLPPSNQGIPYVLPLIPRETSPGDASLGPKVTPVHPLLSRGVSRLLNSSSNPYNEGNILGQVWVQKWRGFEPKMARIGVTMSSLWCELRLTQAKTVSEELWLIKH